ncbi:MAG: hypothetical protein ABIS27_05125, partial [Longimicrobiales bacterium]
GHARAAFATANYTFPPPTVTNTFVATEGSGTVRVLQRFGDGYRISIDATFRDVTGRVATVRGNAQIVVSRYTPPCIS